MPSLCRHPDHCLFPLQRSSACVANTHPIQTQMFPPSPPGLAFASASSWISLSPSSSSILSGALSPSTTHRRRHTRSSFGHRASKRSVTSFNNLFGSHSSVRITGFDYYNSQSTPTSLRSSPLDDLLGGLFGKDEKKESSEKPAVAMSIDNDVKEDDDMSLSSFQQELAKRQSHQLETSAQSADDEGTSVHTKTGEDDEEEFTGYDLRDMIYYKYGECFDVEFQRVDSYGFRTVYLVSCGAVYACVLDCT